MLETRWGSSTASLTDRHVRDSKGWPQRRISLRRRVLQRSNLSSKKVKKTWSDRSPTSWYHSTAQMKRRKECRLGIKASWFMMITRESTLPMGTQRRQIDTSHAKACEKSAQTLSLAPNESWRTIISVRSPQWNVVTTKCWGLIQILIVQQFWPPARAG